MYEDVWRHKNSVPHTLILIAGPFLRRYIHAFYMFQTFSIWKFEVNFRILTPLYELIHFQWNKRNRSKKGSTILVQLWNFEKLLKSLLHNYCIYYLFSHIVSSFQDKSKSILEHYCQIHHQKILQTAIRARCNRTFSRALWRYL